MGTPQGGVASPLLANIFLHLAFDDWMRSTHPDVPFERYADDIVAHCRTETQAQQVLSHIKRRLAHCRLDVHPEKTHIVYCKDDDRPGQYPTEQFTFLGYTFRSRRSKNRWGKYFINFAPAVSNAAATRMRQALRRRHLPRRSDKAIDDGCGSSSSAAQGAFCERHGKSYLTRRRRGGEGGGCGSLTGGAVPSAYRWAWLRWYSRASWKSQYASLLSHIFSTTAASGDVGSPVARAS